MATNEGDADEVMTVPSGSRSDEHTEVFEWRIFFDSLLLRNSTCDVDDVLVENVLSANYGVVTGRCIGDMAATH